ncbi:MAG: DUF1428 domain-containing protein [Parvularculaceae bacterium]|jgi:uncharacterized protein YbaA (DUF1428 family)|nr:DUF1428 domain-containing protein [Parvularculaceae bacterium]
MYVDGFVLPIPDKNAAAYTRMARLGAKVWMKHGALHYVECRADDVKPGKLTSFPQAVKLKKGESVWFSWIVYKSRKHRDEVMKKVMAEFSALGDPLKMPFDGKRMFFGGFKSVVEAGSPTVTRAAGKRPARKARAKKAR